MGGSRGVGLGVALFVFWLLIVPRTLAVVSSVRALIHMVERRTSFGSKVRSAGIRTHCGVLGACRGWSGKGIEGTAGKGVCR
jgi:hypothetical protein